MARTAAEFEDIAAGLGQQADSLTERWVSGAPRFRPGRSGGPDGSEQRKGTGHGRHVRRPEHDGLHVRGRHFVADHGQREAE